MKTFLFFLMISNLSLSIANDKGGNGEPDFQIGQELQKLNNETIVCNVFGSKTIKSLFRNNSRISSTSKNTQYSSKISNGQKAMDIVRSLSESLNWEEGPIDIPHTVISVSPKGRPVTLFEQFSGHVGRSENSKAIAIVNLIKKNCQ